MLLDSHYWFLSPKIYVQSDEKRISIQGMVWNSFGPISASVLAIFCPTWTPATIALLGNWGNIMYIIPLIPVLWYFEEKGLRKSMILTAGLMAVGTMLRCLPFKVGAFTWLVIKLSNRLSLNSESCVLPW